MRDTGTVNTGDFNMTYYDLRETMTAMRGVYCALDWDDASYGAASYEDYYCNLDYLKVCDDLRNIGYSEDDIMFAMVSAQYIVMTVLSLKWSYVLTGIYFNEIRNNETGQEVDFDLPRLVIFWILDMLTKRIKK
jgi:hypothetical protein